MPANTPSVSNLSFLAVGLALIGVLLYVPMEPATTAALMLLVCLGFWITEALPSAVVGLLVPILSVSTGLLTPAKAFESFGSSIVILIICVMILTRVVLTSGLADRLSLLLLAGPLTGTTLRSLVFGVAIACWLSAWWISNTAACALFIPIVLAVCSKLESAIGDSAVLTSVRHRLLLSCAFVPSLGGMSTPVGSLPNLVSLKALADQGIPFTFVEWMAYGLPASLILLIALLLLLEFRYPIPSVSLKTLKHDLKAECAKMPRASYDQWCAGIAFTVTVILWLMPTVGSQLLSGIIPVGLTTLPVHTAAVVGVTVLFAFAGLRQGVSSIDWKSASDFDWGIVLLFAGGLCLGDALTAAHLPELAFSYLGVSQGSLDGLSHLPATVPLVLIPLTIILSEVCSNTVAAAILVPAVLEVIPGNVILPVTIALGAGFGFMLPISTPPNALVYGTGQLPIRHMVVTGLLFDCVGGVLLYLYYLVLLGLLWG